MNDDRDYDMCMLTGSGGVKGGVLSYTHTHTHRTHTYTDTHSTHPHTHTHTHTHTRTQYTLVLTGSLCHVIWGQMTIIYASLPYYKYWVSMIQILNTNITFNIEARWREPLFFPPLKMAIAVQDYSCISISISLTPDIQFCIMSLQNKRLFSW